ncbi:hypothetical protein ACGFZU_06935 [Streptomyces tendae]|uniref:hypothetical protein n=1 Tax=Streptomyces tendae TaxID=1932 RepID=UPI00371966B0
MTDHQPAADRPPTTEDLAAIEALAARATDDPFYVTDCEGKLAVWREKALVHVRRDDHGEIDMYSLPSTYRPTDEVIEEILLDSWDMGEDATDDQRRQDLHDLVDARAAVPLLLAEVRRLQTELAAYEVLNPQQCPTGKHAAWLVDSEFAHACPWCQIDQLRAAVGGSVAVDGDTQ